jgi:hypothetical protein
VARFIYVNRKFAHSFSADDSQAGRMGLKRVVIPGAHRCAQQTAKGQGRRVTGPNFLNSRSPGAHVRRFLAFLVLERRACAGD